MPTEPNKSRTKENNNKDPPTPPSPCAVTPAELTGCHSVGSEVAGNPKPGTTELPSGPAKPASWDPSPIRVKAIDAP